MQAIGLIETKGITGVIIALDAMLKAANVSVLERSFVGGGNVAVTITGDVGAVTAAIEAGEGAIRTLDSSLMISKHIIARPDKGLEDCIIFPMSLKEEESPKEILIEVIEDNTGLEEKKDIKDKAIELEVKLEKPTSEDKKESLSIEDNKPNNKKDLDKMALEYGIDKMDKTLRNLKVKELRKLARNYDDFGIKGSDISNASKGILIKEFKKYYGDK